MHQEPAQSVDIGTGFAAALGHAVGKAMAVALAVLASAPAIASMALLFVGTRWPTLGRSIIANAIGGVVFTGLASLALLAVIIPLNNALNQYDVFYLVLLGLAVAIVLLALFLQIRARATFSWARAAGIASAIATPLAFIFLRGQ